MSCHRPERRASAAGGRKRNLLIGSYCATCDITVRKYSFVFLVHDVRSKRFETVHSECKPIICLLRAFLHSQWNMMRRIVVLCQILCLSQGFHVNDQRMRRSAHSRSTGRQGSLFPSIFNGSLSEAPRTVREHEM
jgi:hypothetical protein